MAILASLVSCAEVRRRCGRSPGGKWQPEKPYGMTLRRCFIMGKSDVMLLQYKTLNQNSNREVILWMKRKLQIVSTVNL
jgi:hypothetical protein